MLVIFENYFNRKHFSAGVINEDYKGNLGILLFNHSDKAFTVNVGDKVVQLICEKIVLKLLNLRYVFNIIKCNSFIYPHGVNYVISDWI